MRRPRLQDDRAPRETRVFDEPVGIRYELPVVVSGAPGMLVIRWFDDRDQGEMSIRGRAAMTLETQPRPKDRR